MNIFAKITNKTMKQNKARTIMTIIGVILATSMVTAVITLGTSIQKFMYDYAVKTDGNWHVAAKGVSAQKTDTFTENKKVKDSCVISEIGYADISEKKERSVFGDYLYIQTMNKKAADMLKVKLTQGRLPKNENEIILHAGYEFHGQKVKIGNTIELSIGNRISRTGEKLRYNVESETDENFKLTETFEEKEKRTVHVVGFLEHWGNTKRGGAGDDAFVGESKEVPMVNQIYMQMKDPKQVFEFIKEHKGEAVFEENSGVLKWMGISGNESVKGMLNGMYTILILIIGVGAVSLIYNAFSISFRERTTQFGLLASLGATRRQLKRSMWHEAWVVGITGIPFGILCGLGGIWVTLQFIGNSMAQWIYSEPNGKISFHTSVWAVIFAAVIAFIIICLSVWIPAAKIKKITPLEAIRANRDIKIKAKEVKSPKIIQKVFGLEAMIADKNYKRDKKKYRATVFSLTVSIVLFVSATLFSDYMSKTGAFMLDAPDYELQYLKESEKKEEYQELLRMFEQGKDVEKVDSYGSLYLTLKLDAEDVTKEGREYFGEETSFSQVLSLPDEKFRNLAKENKIKDTSYFRRGNNEVLYYDETQYYNPDSKRYETFHSLKENGKIKGTLLPDSDEEMTKEGRKAEKSILLKEKLKKVPDYLDLKQSGSFCTILIPESRMEEFTSDLTKTDVTYWYQIQSSNHKKTYEDLLEKIKKEGKDSEYLMDLAERYEVDRGIKIAINVLACGFIVLISLIAAVNVFNTISTNIMLRKREFAMLKSMGMNQKQIRKMMNYECMIYGIRSILYGFVVSLLISFAMYVVLSRGAAIEYKTPWFSLLISMIWVFAVVFATMLYSMRKIKKQNIIEELKKD